MTWSLTMSNVFTHAENVITSMLPAVYLMAGLSVGFVVVSRIIRAFK
jgi:hypothetical protein